VTEFSNPRVLRTWKSAYERMRARGDPEAEKLLSDIERLEKALGEEPTIRGNKPR
jgi:hypothetical protein